MIIKLEFDMFYTTIEATGFSEKELRSDLDEKLYDWLMGHHHYIEEDGSFLGYSYNDDNVIKYLDEVRFKGEGIRVLEKHNSIGQKSNYKIDCTFFF